MNNYFIKILDKTNNKTWQENFDSYYLFKRRYNKLRFSKKLTMVSYSNLVD